MSTRVESAPAADQPASPAPGKPLGVIRALGIAHRTTWHQPLFYVLTVVVMQLVVIGCLVPLFQLIYRLVLLETGLGSIAFDKFMTVLTNPLADITLLVLAVLAVIVIAAGFSTVFILAAHHQAEGSTSFRAVLAQLADTARDVLHPQGLLLVVYLLLVLPLGHLGLSFALTEKIGVPPFVTEELAKSPVSNAAYTAFLVVITWLNLRLIFTLPVMATTKAGVWDGFVVSWRITRGLRIFRVLGLILCISVPVAVATTLIGLLAVLPTVITDQVAPAWSPLAAAAGLAGWQVATFAVSALALVMLAQGLVALMRDWEARLPDRHTRAEIVIATPSTISRRRRGVLWAATALLTVVALVVLTVGNVSTMQRVASSAGTAVLAHRGFTQGGVENTLPALQAAARAGAPRVEFDILETKDRKFVVMHDTNLSRLAGRNVEVKDLTQAELMDITVRADGMEAKIPSLEQWIDESKRLDVPQLLEIKYHGGESPELVANLLRLLDEKGVTDWYHYHTLSRSYAEQVEAARPDLIVGFIVPIAFGGVPKVRCDFIVIEQASYSDAFLEQARDAGYDVVVWTIEEEEAMRQFVDLGVDGIISDRIDLALQTEQTLKGEKGFSGRLVDLITR